MIGPVLLTDTTLRDGEQSPGFSLSADEKVRLAALLDEAGFAIIEAGIPASGSAEKDTIIRILAQRRHARIATWNRLREQDIGHSLDCQPDIIHISVPGSDVLLCGVLGRDRIWALNTLRACAERARLGGAAVTVGVQDIARADGIFLIQLARQAQAVGAQALRLADTVGILTPARARQLVAALKEHTDLPLGIHAHNDLGMATAVAIEAVKGGASLVDTTLFGVGERAGNCDCFKFTHQTQTWDIQPDAHRLRELRTQATDLLGDRLARWGTL